MDEQPIFNNWQRFSGDTITFTKPINNEQVKVTIFAIEQVTLVSQTPMSSARCYVNISIAVTFITEYIVTRCCFEI